MLLYLTILAVVVIAILVFRRRKERAGRRCWQCGATIEGNPYLCPECGETLQEEEDDVDPDAEDEDDDTWDDDEDEEDDRYSFPGNRN